MPCCNAYSIDPGVGALLFGAKVLLVAAQNLKVGTSVVPIPCIGPVTTALVSLIDKIVETRSKDDALHDVSWEVLQLANTVDRAMLKVKRDIEELPSGDVRRDALVEGLMGSSKLEYHVLRLFNDLGELDMKADWLYKGPWWLRWIHSSRDAAMLEELRKGIVECRLYFKLEFQIAIEASMEEVLEKFSSIEEKVADAEVVVEVVDNANDRDEKTLESLPHTEASYRAAGNATKSNLLPGTRVELLEETNDWVEGRSEELSDKAVCILTGDAGTGKSTIAWEFARQRDDKGDYGASFFCVRGSADVDSTRLVFPTVAYQLAQSQEALRPHIVRAAREHLEQGKIQQMVFQAQSLINGPVHEVISEHPPMVLVVDALDQCSEETCNLVPDMLDWVIESVRQARFPLRIFLTSHPNSLIENTLRHSQWAPLVHMISLHDLPPESVKRDMAMFVRDKMTKIPSGQALLQQRPEVGERLAKRAGDLFVYAPTALDFLGDYPGFVEEGLDELLSKGTSQFASVLEPLDDLYLTVPETAFPQKDLYRALRFRQALEATLGSLAVLEALTGIPCGDVYNVLRRLGSVVLFDETKFLVDPTRCMSPWYHVSARCQHAHLAVGCLRPLEAREENMYMCHLPDPAVPRTDVPSVEGRLAKDLPERVRYACVHWAAHLGDACELGKKHIGTAWGCMELGERLAAFARTKLWTWVEMMTYMGRLDTVKEALGAARAYLKGAPRYQEVDTLLVGAQQLVVDHYSAIEDCPYHVHQARSTPSGSSSTLDGSDDA